MTGGHFSVLRFALGVWLAIGLGSRSTSESDPKTLVIHLSGVLFAVAVALGWWSRLAAVCLAAVIVVEHAGSDLGPAVLVAVPLGLVAALPVAPYGSMDARGRPDPGGGFEIPEGVVRGVIALVLGVALLFSFEERGLTGDALVPAWTGATSLFAVLAWSKRTRAVAVLALGAALVARIALRPDDMWSPPLAFVLLLAFDADFVPPLRASEPDRVFYDGACGLCHRAVRFALAEDRAGNAVRFAPIAGDAFLDSVPEELRANLPDSIVVRTAEGALLVRSAALLRVGERMGGIWRAAALLVRLVPRAIRDFGYDRVAAIRHRLFAKPADVCPVVPRELRARFDA